MKARRGFTLIELLVVIAIIGILSSVVLASLNSARSKSRDARRIADLKQLQLALELYYDGAGNQYPALLSALVPTYISTVPKDPGTGSLYAYAALTVGGTCSAYHLGALLENGTNAALLTDADNAGGGTTCSGSSGNFNGTGAGASNSCDGTAGTPRSSGGSGTELCYDVTN